MTLDTLDALPVYRREQLIEMLNIRAEVVAQHASAADLINPLA